jgi:hypothetical protein
MTAPRQLRCVPSCVVVVCEFWFQLTVATSTAARGLETAGALDGWRPPDRARVARAQGSCLVRNVPSHDLRGTQRSPRGRKPQKRQTASRGPWPA